MNVTKLDNLSYSDLEVLATRLADYVGPWTPLGIDGQPCGVLEAPEGASWVRWRAEAHPARSAAMIKLTPEGLWSWYVATPAWRGKDSAVWPICRSLEAAQAICDKTLERDGILFAVGALVVAAPVAAPDCPTCGDLGIGTEHIDCDLHVYPCEDCDAGRGVPAYVFGAWRPGAASLPKLVRQFLARPTPVETPDAKD